MSELRIPRVTLPAPQGEFQVVDLADVRFNGEPFPFPTMGDFAIELHDEGLPTMTITFPIQLVTADG